MAKPIGMIYRIHRKKAGISLEKLASEVEMSKNKLSNFENGRVYFDDKTIKKLCRCIGMIYVDNADIEKFVAETFELFIQNYLAYESCDASYKQIVSMKEKILLSPSYLIIVLVEYIYNIVSHNGLYDCDDLANIINENIELYDNREKQIFFDITGLYFVYRKDYLKASEYFEKALSYGNEPMNALVYFHKALLYLKQRNWLESLLIFNQSTFIFDYHLLFKRALLSQAFKTLVYVRFQSFDTAINLYKSLIPNMERMGMRTETIFFKNELTWAYVFSRQYHYVLKNTDEILKNDRNHVFSYFLKSYALFKLDDKVQAKIEIKKAKKIKDYTVSPSIKALVDSLYTLLSANKEFSAKLNKLNMALISAIKNGQTRIQIFLLCIIIDYLSEIYCDSEKINCYLFMIKCLYENRTLDVKLIQHLVK